MFVLIINSVLLGIGLAMDAFSVSVIDGLAEPQMSRKKRCLIAGCFAGFQFVMPLLGWLLVTSVASLFDFSEKIIPWLALAILGFLGIKMIVEGVRSKKEDVSCRSVSLPAILLQGIATSIDALSVGLTISHYLWYDSLLCSSIIGIETFIICTVGLFLGIKIGEHLSMKVRIIGGIILVGIGIEILVTSFF